LTNTYQKGRNFETMRANRVFSPLKNKVNRTKGWEQM